MLKFCQFDKILIRTCVLANCKLCPLNNSLKLIWYYTTDNMLFFMFLCVFNKTVQGWGPCVWRGGGGGGVGGRGSSERGMGRRGERYIECSG